MSKKFRIHVENGDVQLWANGNLRSPGDFLLLLTKKPNGYFDLGFDSDASFEANSGNHRYWCDDFKTDEERQTEAGLAALREKFGKRNVELIEWSPSTANFIFTGQPPDPKPDKPFKCIVILGGRGENRSLGKIRAFGKTRLEAIQETQRIAESITMFD